MIRTFAGVALGWADIVSHWPGIRRVVPLRVQWWLCDVMDWSLGEDWDQLRQTTRERHR